MVKYRAIVGPVAVILIFVAGMYFSPFEPHRPPVGPAGTPLGEISWDDADWDVLATTVRSALAVRADTLPMGAAMGVVGRSLVGTAYVPHTLEVEGPERLVIDFQGLDCVTFVENVYATAALLRSEIDLGDRADVEAEYERILSALRYRNGFIDGYQSRLHYFTDWIADGERKLLVEDVTSELGGIEDSEPVDFMSTHPDAYRQLDDPDVLDAIRVAEASLSARPRIYLPQERIADVSSSIREGDIIAATSTVEGLDVAHTGIAVRVEGTLRLMHAPLAGEAVQVSERTLAERIVAIDSQDGIIVARPLEPLTARRPDSQRPQAP
jgi:hypothetical protein